MEYLTTAEVAELKGCTARYVRQLAQNDKLEHIEKDSAANNRTEYVFPLAALPEKLQIKYENKKRGELGLEPVPLPCKAAPKPDPRQITLQDLTGDQRRDVGFWCEIIKSWQATRLNKGAELGKCKVDELFCAAIKLQYPNISISPDILYRKYKAYKDGNIDGLVDHRGGHNRGRTDIPQYMLDAFYTLYLHDNKLPVSRCYSLLQTWVREHYPEAAGNIPSERTFRRKTEALPYALVMFMREGDKMFADKCLPYIERLYDDLKANDVWIADNHTFDFFTEGENAKNLSNAVGYLTDVQRRLMSSSVVIEHKDFENLIKVYDRQKALFYCDPPYHSTEKYYDVQFTEADHIRLRDTLAAIKGKFLLSYNDDEFIRGLYKDFKTEAVERQNNISGGRFKELIITNY